MPTSDDCSDVMLPRPGLGRSDEDGRELVDERPIRDYAIAICQIMLLEISIVCRLIVMDVPVFYHSLISPQRNRR